ncbi:MAG: hypothetical protein V2B19_33230 [Pseudomonadota bacterium]
MIVRGDPGPIRIKGVYTMPVTAFCLILTLSMVSMGGSVDDTNSMSTRKEEPTVTVQTDRPASVEWIKKGRGLGLEPAIGIKIIEEIQSVFDSCRGRDKRLVDEALWEEIRKSGTCIHIRYDGPQSLPLTVRQDLVVTEILIPFEPKSWHGKILSKNGDIYYSPFISCDPGRLELLLAD